MATAAVLLMDLQRDFLDRRRGRLPVGPAAAEAVLRVANDVLSGRVLPDAKRVVVMNCFPPSDRIGNFFRRGAALAGSDGAALDDRLHGAAAAKVIVKASPSAFSNPELLHYLQANEVTTLFVLGVYAEGCVRSTVLDGLKLGYQVTLVESAVASNAGWKKRWAVWSMKRAGAVAAPGLVANDSTLVVPARS